MQVDSAQQPPHILLPCCLQDAYFLDSASEINFFFEEKAFNEQGQLQTPKALAVNKIGHAMHDLDPVFRAFTRSQPVSAVLRSLGFQRPLPVQSMYIFKQPSIGGEVVSLGAWRCSMCCSGMCT
jgi:phytanoyl-CoA hydroxylase